MIRILKTLVFLCLIFSLPAAIASASKIALVMGNSAYTSVEALANPAKDARAISSALRQLGFKVHEHLDMNRRQMRYALRAFSLSLEPGAVAVVYYAGHGIQVGRENYLLPVDTDIAEEYEIPDEGLSMSAVLRALRSTNASLSMVMLDACRNNPFEERLRGSSRAVNAGGQGLAAVDAVRGSLLSYATQPGNVAADGIGAHSPYTAALLDWLAEPGLTVQTMFNRVGLQVLDSTAHRQEPWLSISPIPNFCFAGCEQPNRLTVRDGAYAQQRIDRFKRLFEAGNLSALEEICRLDGDQKTQLTHIFDKYDKLSLKINEFEVFEDQGYVSASIEIEEARNDLGNRIVPSDAWKEMQIRLEKKKGNWNKISWK